MTDETGDAIVVLVTAGSSEEAARLAELLVGARLAACVQIMPQMESVYHWKGNIERAPEVLLIAKTTGANFAELESAVRALHSYETPEIVALPVAAISATYLEWLTTTVKPHQRMRDEPEEAGTTGEGAAQGAKG